MALALTVPAAAQTGVTVLGTISDAGNDVAIDGAIVTLQGLGSTMTTPEGAFRFREIRPGQYVLHVEAFGYAPLDLPVALATDTTLVLTLEAAPLAIDAIVVEAGTIDFEGRVRDPRRDFWVVDAQVLARGHEPVWTDTHGRFDLLRLAEGVPLQLTIRAFGYLPLDTTLVPDDAERYDFSLERDAFAEAMISTQVRRLEERARGRVVPGFASMDRGEILRFAGAHTVATMLEFELPERIRDRIACVVIDEQIDANFSFGEGIGASILAHTLPEEIERVELLVFDAVEGRPIMLQLFSRTFVMAMGRGDARPRINPMINPFGGCS